MDRIITCNIGNTNTQIAGWVGKRMVKVVQFGTHRLPEQRFKFKKPDFVLTASTVPDIAEEWRRIVKDLYGMDTKFISKDVGFGIEIRYKNKIGQDRISNMAGGYQISGENFIVIDIGTATTIDVVIEALYEGGLILAGIDLGLRALHRYTSQLPRVTLERIEEITGKDTIECILSGAYWGEVTRIGGLVERIKEKFSKDLPVLTTGGLGEDISRELGYRYERWLTIRGIKFIADKAGYI